ncbi:MAG: prolyl aminopeptidase [Gammaproteobacteria bacterium]|nr:prolyl aminopeptidase [Gammaproteobacteria bacterium]|tara:strand:- start:6722 stop:7684 length:963 start_codon:yes stop_codon:yes gene_type:complete
MELLINSLYPPIEPFFTDTLAVSPRHSLYVERSGKQGGHPIIFLHGGPGSQVRAAHRRYFDPEFFDIVLFDQRGCGQSMPAGETQDNNTQALVEDINTIREALDIRGRMSLFGGSWGSTLALVYALHYPENIAAMILRGIFLASTNEISWFTQGVARFAPKAWQQLTDGMGDDLIDAYYQAVFSTDERSASEAARRWTAFEMQIMGIGTQAPGADPIPAPQASLALLNRARVQLHFLKNQSFLADTSLLDTAQTIQVPTTIVHGELDFVCPPITAWRLNQSLPNSRLRMVNNAGHGGLSDQLAPALREEVDALRDRLLSQ